MNINFKQNNPIKHQEDSKIMQLSDFTELSDQELELLVGGALIWISRGTGSSGTASSGTGS